MDTPGVYHSIIAGEGSGIRWPIRGALRAASAFYGAGVWLRNRWYDHHPPATTRPRVPIISVGNLTTGGTGKTPLVFHLVRELLARGCRPAIVSRGYRSTPAHEADELTLARRRLPEVICVADPDRVSAARRAVEQHRADVLVLDDAFQHRRLARDLDLVVLDATCPFGHGHLLPRGLLREPLVELKRASLLVISRADLVDDAALAWLGAALARHATGLPQIQCRHRPTGLLRIDGTGAGVDVPDAGPAFCFAAIGNPAAFRATVERMGIGVAGARGWPDHHRYTESDVAALCDAARRAGASWLVTTEKDAVKLPDASLRWTHPVYVVRIEIDFLGDGDTILSAALDRVLAATSDRNVQASVSTD